MKRAIVLLSNSEYEKYLSYMLHQLNGCGMDTFVISESPISASGVSTIDPSWFISRIMLPDSLKINNWLRYAYVKLIIPYAEQLQSYDKVLYMDVDIVLRNGWLDVFNESGNGDKYILSVQDSGLNEEKLKSDNFPCYRYYNGRKFSYANTGVMLFDQSRREKFIAMDAMVEWVRIATTESFNYADQCLLNACDMIDCSLPEKFNCVSVRVNDVDDVRIVHYASPGQKKRLIRILPSTLFADFVNCV